MRPTVYAKHDKGTGEFPLMMLAGRDLSVAALRGMWLFTRQHPGWSMMRLSIEEALQRGNGSVPWVNGVVMGIHDTAGAKMARGIGVPVVNTFPFVYDNLPAVCVDNRAVARLAFEHLRGLGLTRFGYLPWHLGPDNLQRQECFLDEARAAGFSGDRAIIVPNRLSTSNWHEDVRAQAEIFKTLPKPIGLFVYADWLASMATHALRAAGINVPGEVAILGVDDDEITCEGISPQLSSVDCNMEKVGFEAASLLDRIVRGAAIPKQPLLVQPRGVIERASTQLLAVDDQDVTDALRYIGKSFTGGKIPSVAEVAEAVSISRRSLDAKFTKSVGHTVSEELGRRQLRAVRDLLERTNLTPSEIASRCGFKTVNHLSYVVKQATGFPPIEYRKSCQLRPVAGDD